MEVRSGQFAPELNRVGSGASWEVEEVEGWQFESCRQPLRLSVQEPEGGADAQSWNQDQEPGPEADGG